MSVRLRYSPDNRWVIEADEMSAYDPSDGTDNPLDSGATVEIIARRKNNGTQIAGETWPKALTWREDGEFYAYLSKDLVVDPKLAYEVVVQGDDGDGSDFKWVKPLEVRDPRRGGD